MKKPHRNTLKKPYRFPFSKDLRTIPRVEIGMDACSTGGWKSLTRYQKEEGLIECHAIGFMTKRDHREIQIVQQFSAAGNLNDSLTIPASCVKRIQRLR